jgi:hypothetical protein
MHTDLTWSPGTTGIVLAVLVGHADTELSARLTKNVERISVFCDDCL